MKTLSIVTTKGFAKELKKNRGMFAHVESETSMYVSALYIEKDLDHIDMETKYFEGETPEDMINKINAWMNDATQWAHKNKLMVFDYNDNPFDIDLKLELLELGFKSVAILHEDSNFPEIVCKYCYKDESGKVRYDGVMHIHDVGDKFTCLKFFKEWTQTSPTFFPTKNRL